MRNPDLKYSPEASGYSVAIGEHVPEAAARAFRECAKGVRWRPRRIKESALCVTLVLTSDDRAIVARLSQAHTDAFGRSHGMMIHAWLCGRAGQEIRDVLMELGVSSDAADGLLRELDAQPEGVPVLAGDVEALDRPENWTVLCNQSAVRQSREQPMGTAASLASAQYQSKAIEKRGATASTGSGARLAAVALASLIAGLLVGGGTVWWIMHREGLSTQRDAQRLQSEWNRVAEEHGVATTPHSVNELIRQLKRRTE